MSAKARSATIHALGQCSAEGWLALTGDDAAQVNREIHRQPWPSGADFPDAACWRAIGGDPPRRLGRMEVASRVAVLAADIIGETIRKVSAPPEDFGIIALTRTGSLAVDLEYWQTAEAGEPSPHLFARTLPNVPASEVSQRFGLKGPCRVRIIGGPENARETLEQDAADAFARGEMRACLGLHFEVYPLDLPPVTKGGETGAKAWLFLPG